MFGIVRNIFVIAVLAGLWFACKPFQKWLRKRKTPWLILGTGYALLIFLCSFIVPETTLIGFDSPLAAYAYAKSPGEADYEQMIDCETSTLLITRKGTNNISTSILLKKEGKSYITPPFSFSFKKAFDYETALCADCLAHPQLDETYWLLFNMDGSVGESIVTLNDKLPEVIMEAGSRNGKTDYDRVYVLPSNTTRIELGIDGEIAAVYELNENGWKLCSN